MAEGYDDNPASRGVKPAGSAQKAPWGSDRRTSPRSAPKAGPAAAAAAARNKAPDVPRVGTTEGAEGPVGDAAHTLGFRDTTVLDDDVPEQLRPKSHRRKSDSQVPPTPPAPPIQTPDFSGILLGMVEGLVAAAWGDDARFTLNERKLIQPPFGRILQRMSPEDGAKFTALADPILLGTGLMVWGMRIWTLQQRAGNLSGPTPIRRDTPVVQGMPEDQVRTAHAPSNGTANVASEIAENWGTLG